MKLPVRYDSGREDPSSQGKIEYKNISRFGASQSRASFLETNHHPNFRAMSCSKYREKLAVKTLHVSLSIAITTGDFLAF